MKPQLSLAINPTRIVTFLLIVTATLILAHIVFISLWYHEVISSDNWHYISIFDLDEEASLGTWFSAILLLVAAQLLLVIGIFHKQQQQRYSIGWLVLATGFYILSLDEVAGFHELANTAMTTHWSIFGLVITIIIAILYLKFLWILPVKTRYLFIISGLLYIGGAVCMEWGTIWYEEHDQLDSLAYNLWNALEEGLEMLGIVIFIYSLLDYMRSQNTFEKITIKLS
jgi:hypothetical protein